MINWWSDALLWLNFLFSLLRLGLETQSIVASDVFSFNTHMYMVRYVLGWRRRLTTKRKTPQTEAVSKLRKANLDLVVPTVTFSWYILFEPRWERPVQTIPLNICFLRHQLVLFVWTHMVTSVKLLFLLSKKFLLGHEDMLQVYKRNFTMYWVVTFFRS